MAARYPRNIVGLGRGYMGRDLGSSVSELLALPA